MSEDAGGSNERQPITISISQVWSKVKSQPIDEKLFTWGAIIFTLSGVLPPVSWTNSVLGFVHVAVLVGLLVHVGGLIGIGPGGGNGFWRIYRYAALAVLAIVSIRLLALLADIGSWPLGWLLELLSIAVHLYAVYRILDKRGLLLFRITK